jgi:hypothetical protein
MHTKESTAVEDNGDKERSQAIDIPLPASDWKQWSRNIRDVQAGNWTQVGSATDFGGAIALVARHEDSTLWSPS